jgi:hypothetical protein
LPAGAQHSDGEYGARVDAEGRHHGGPFRMDVAPKMRVQDVRRVIMVRCRQCAAGSIASRQCPPHPHPACRARQAQALAGASRHPSGRAAAAQDSDRIGWVLLMVMCLPQAHHHLCPATQDMRQVASCPARADAGVGGETQEKSGIPVGLQRLSYAGKHMEDSQRTLEQCALALFLVRRAPICTLQAWLQHMTMLLLCMSSVHNLSCMANTSVLAWAAAMVWHTGMRASQTGR